MTVTLGVRAERAGRQSGRRRRAAWGWGAHGGWHAVGGVCISWASVLGCNRADVAKPGLAPAAERPYAAVIHQPGRLGKVLLGAPAAQAGAASPARGAEPGPRSSAVRCETCHALRPTAVLPASMRELDQFHQGLELAHGALACASCHTRSAPVTLHLADGSGLPRARAIELCRQCHGTQYRDYEHGAHGGMSGHWDLSRGPRLRNHCMDCHDPHAPQIRPVLPSAPPRDRFFGSRSASAEGARH